MTTTIIHARTRISSMCAASNTSQLLTRSVIDYILLLSIAYFMNNLLSVRQAAFILKVHPLSIRRYISQGKLKAIKIGGNVRITEQALQDFQREITQSPHPTEILTKIKKTIVKEFTIDDPFLRLKGRGASLR